MTLDHVAPRRGLTAYDRRDNLVLACAGCNTAKADQSPIAYLLASRARAANLLRYGAHLSPMLLELARSLAPAEAHPSGNGTSGGRSGSSASGEEDDGDSPYRD